MADEQGALVTGPQAAPRLDVNEVEDGLELLYSLGLRERKGAELIACPTCGRIQVDLISLVQDVRKTVAAKIELPIKVAVMGCIVNGPGEAEGADVAVFAGDRRGIIYVQGEKVANVPEEQILEKLLAECLAFRQQAGDVLPLRLRLADRLGVRIARGAYLVGRDLRRLAPLLERAETRDVELEAATREVRGDGVGIGTELAGVEHEGNSRGERREL